MSKFKTAKEDMIESKLDDSNKMYDTSIISDGPSPELLSVIETTQQLHTEERKSELLRISFSSGRVLEIDLTREEELLHIIGSTGEVELKIRMTPEGPVLCFEAASLSLLGTNKVSVASRHISLKASDRITMETSGDMVCTVDGDHNSKIIGDMNCEARIQNITARLGNVNVKANDDVKLNGERIMMNC